MDKLDELFMMQKALNDDISASRNLGSQEIGKDVWIQRQTLAMVSELAEVLDEVNFKWWKNPKEINDANLKEEIVDLWHFLLSMSLTAGMTAEELSEIYKHKNQENFDRQHGKSQKEGYKQD